jgi:hypothetical protein
VSTPTRASASAGGVDDDNACSVGGGDHGCCSGVATAPDSPVPTKDQQVLMEQRLERSKDALSKVQQSQADKKRRKAEGKLQEDESDSEGSDIDEEEREFLDKTYGQAKPVLERTASGGTRSPLLARPSVKKLAGHYDKWVKTGIFAVDLNSL